MEGFLEEVAWSRDGAGDKTWEHICPTHRGGLGPAGCVEGPVAQVEP